MNDHSVDVNKQVRPTTTDPRAVAAQLWCLPQHAHKEMDVEFAESIAHALADAERRGLERAAGICEAEALIDDERGYYGKEMAKAIRLKADEIN